MEVEPLISLLINDLGVKGSKDMGSLRLSVVSGRLFIIAETLYMKVLSDSSSRFSPSWCIIEDKMLWTVRIYLSHTPPK